MWATSVASASATSVASARTTRVVPTLDAPSDPGLRTRTIVGLAA